MKKFTTILATCVAVMALIAPAACEKKGPYAEGKAAAGSTQSAADTAGSKEIVWSGYTEGMKKAKETGKPVMVDFYTTWCKWCKTLDETTYKDADIVRMLNNDFIAIKVNAESTAKIMEDGKEMTEADLAKKLQVSGFPTIWFFDKDGKQIAPLSGYNPPEEFKPILGYISGGSYAKGIKYEDYLKSMQKK